MDLNLVTLRPGIVPFSVHIYCVVCIFLLTPILPSLLCRTTAHILRITHTYFSNMRYYCPRRTLLKYYSCGTIEICPRGSIRC
ncbi:hypothetical protein CY34DRAFT_577047 [Suillus luteus UH-Slu-Lm8-n1]|uniref:Uncharacterized protein n=1 Tax=Suillus luteus UH-Slu-Lm8-n1 TaxID=930992 RepID=A0A0D0C175_9AGAM|nr:hypothetical protein CY34DRAFT_577047 [Suillus luteus UH-Slu-Lm8-n1]